MMGESWKRMAEKAADALATVTTERDGARDALAQEQGRSQGLREVCEMLRRDLGTVTRERDEARAMADERETSSAQRAAVLLSDRAAARAQVAGLTEQLDTEKGCAAAFQAVVVEQIKALTTLTVLAGMALDGLERFIAGFRPKWSSEEWYALRDALRVAIEDGAAIARAEAGEGADRG